MQGISGQASAVNSTIAAQGANASTSTQATLLKKALQGQKTEAAQLLQMLEGKGKIVDIRA
ncbi:MAG: hypothetical protein JST12_00155 [Armatimonadetes bacterium]|nr:hypothetical protein [Armatimonadota bacterium]MBS1700046.1 hypothetical protein [Armatimonadota bacterium]